MSKNQYHVEDVIKSLRICSVRYRIHTGSSLRSVSELSASIISSSGLQPCLSQHTINRSADTRISGSSACRNRRSKRKRSLR